ncbi:MAG: NAD-dependent epimerase/dehydratase family protein [Candidatus Nezhaarchaeota archaeon]|nr:NAD-dependent epimerase/dehydratase family protein [Candidatus Nezhaarchaeota archaeon]
MKSCLKDPATTSTCSKPSPSKQARGATSKELSKLMGEEAVKSYARRGLKHVTLRLFNVYGPGQSSSYAGVITRFMERIRANKPPIIHGDGQQTRDFIHVYDVAEAIRLSA